MNARKSRVALSVIFSLVALSSHLDAQVSALQGEPQVATGSLARSIVSAMRENLKALVVSQEAYYKAHDRYGSVLGTPGDTSRVQLHVSPGVTVTLVYTTTSSWTARATHDWWPWRSCIIAVGTIPPSRMLRTTMNKLTTSRDGVPVCDPIK